ncbi:MAG TPA: hypothetical protein DCM40_20940, partial [Maribacter sp.]|nr:hypothetical protein [Maribacter sp.]
SVNQTQITTSHSLQRMATSRGGQRWLIKFTYPPMSREEFNPIWSFLIKQRGRFNAFTLALPNHETLSPLPLATGSNVLKINKDVGAGENILDIKNFTANTTGVIKAGDYFRIASSNKTYIAVEDYNSNANKRALVTTYPSLVQPISENDIVTFEPVFRVSLVNDNMTVSIPSDTTRNFSVEFIETITSSVYTSTAPTSEADFTPHYMYDSYGYSYYASTYSQHQTYASLGYTHTAP